MKKSVLFTAIFILSVAQGIAQVGINSDNSAPNSSAMLDVKSTISGFLPPRMTTAQRNTIASPAEGLVIYNTEEKTLNVYNGVAWRSMMPIPAFVCGSTISMNHLVSGGVAPVNKTVTYGTVTNISGEPAKCWITSNLGSEHQATAVNDATEASAGWYWQFNRLQGYQNTGGSSVTPAWTIPSINENSDWVTTNDPCTVELGIPWRIPTYSELFNVDNAGNWISWSGPWNSGLKLHAAGSLNDNNGALYERGSYGYYWSCTQYFLNLTGWYLVFNNSSSGINNILSKAHGFSIRCLRQ